MKRNSQSILTVPALVVFAIQAACVSDARDRIQALVTLCRQPMSRWRVRSFLLVIALAVLSIAFIAHDGETHWMEGVQLLAVYIILALGFYFLPVPRG